MSVFSLIYSMEDSVPPEVEEDYLPFSWSDSKWAHLVHNEEIFNFKLELLTSFWQALLGILCIATVHNCSMSDYESNYSALFTPTRTSSRRRCTADIRRSGTSYGGYDPGYPRQTTWATPQGWSSPQDEALWSTALLGTPRKTPGKYPEDTTRSVRIRLIP